MKEKKEETKTEIQENRFTKEQLLNSKRYADRKDLLNVLLEDNKPYSVSDVDKLISKFMKGKVK